MAMDFNKAANDFLNTPAGAKLSGKKEEINRLIDSPEAQSVKKMLGGSEDDLMAALEKGDMNTLKKALSNILKTDDGARLADQIMNMMK